MLLKDLYKEAKENYAEVKKVKDGEYRIRFKSIRDTSKWNTYSEVMKIKDSITDETTQVTVHGVVRKKNKIPKTYSFHCNKNKTLAFKRWIDLLAKVITNRGDKYCGAKGRIIKNQMNLPKHLKPRPSSGITILLQNVICVIRIVFKEKIRKIINVLFVVILVKELYLDIVNKRKDLKVKNGMLKI